MLEVWRHTLTILQPCYVKFVNIDKGRITHLERKVIVYYSGGKTIFGVGGQREKNIKDVDMSEYKNKFYVYKRDKNILSTMYIP